MTQRYKKLPIWKSRLEATDSRTARLTNGEVKGSGDPERDNQRSKAWLRKQIRKAEQYNRKPGS